MSVLPTVDLIKLWSDCIFTVVLLVVTFDKYIPKEDEANGDSVVAEAKRELEAQEAEEGEQVHIVMTQQDQQPADTQVFSREMFASREPKEETDSADTQDNKEEQK